jgi:hypothetical protein
MKDTRTKIKNLPIGQQMDFKPFLITYTVYRQAENKYELDCTAHGWLSCSVDKKQMNDILKNPKLLYSLDWA